MFELYLPTFVYRKRKGFISYLFVYYYHQFYFINVSIQHIQMIVNVSGYVIMNFKNIVLTSQYQTREYFSFNSMFVQAANYLN